MRSEAATICGTSRKCATVTAARRARPGSARAGSVRAAAAGARTTTWPSAAKSFAVSRLPIRGWPLRAMHARRSAMRRSLRSRPAAPRGAGPSARSSAPVSSGRRMAVTIERPEHQARARRGLGEPRGEPGGEDEARVVRGRDVERLLAERGVEEVAAREHLADALEEIAERRSQPPRAARELEPGRGADEQLVADDLAHPLQREVRERLARGDEVRDAGKLPGAQQRLDGLDEPGVERLREPRDAEPHRDSVMCRGACARRQGAATARPHRSR